jgi:hypothetical protein
MARKKPARRQRAQAAPKPVVTIERIDTAEDAARLRQVVERAAQDNAFKLRLLNDLAEAMKAAGVELQLGPETAAGAPPSAGEAAEGAKAPRQEGLMPIALHFSGTVTLKIGAVYTNLNTDR